MFSNIQKNNIRWTIRDNLEESILDNLYLKLKDFAACPDFSIVKENNVRTVLFLKPSKNTPDRIFVKLYKKGGLFEKIKHLVIPSKAFSEWRNLKHFDKWKNHEQILEYYNLLVIHREDGSEQTAFHQHEKVRFVDAPQIALSATYIRNAIKNGKSIRYLVHPEVESLIKRKGFYQ